MITDRLIDPKVAEAIKRVFEDWVIVIDDGHGWETPGKQSIDGSLRENEFNASVEDKLSFLLNKCGIEYYALASGWADEALDKRSKMENDLYYNAKSQQKTLLGISIHADAFPNFSANGFAVYYFQKGDKYSKNGKILSRYVADAIIANDFTNGHIMEPRHDNGIVGANFHMLRKTKGIWVLVENAFMTNERDLMYLKRDNFRNNRALALFAGLYNFANNEKPES